MSFIESETQELKKSTAQLERALKAVCGFLNHKGGIIYFGINNHGEIEGQDVSDTTLKNKTIANKEYQVLFGVSRNTASKDLNDLVEKRIVKRAGEGKRRIRYLLN